MLNFSTQTGLEVAEFLHILRVLCWLGRWPVKMEIMPNLAWVEFEVEVEAGLGLAWQNQLPPGSEYMGVRAVCRAHNHYLVSNKPEF